MPSTSRRSIVTLLVAAATILGGCVRGDDNANGGLANTSWTVVSIGGAPTLAVAQPTIDFAPDGTVSGASGCNQYSGRFRTDGGTISVGQLASTMMGCEADRMAQELALSAALSGATRWRVTESGDLELGGAALIVAVPTGRAEASPPAEGPVGTWNLIELGTTADFAHLKPTISFIADGSVAGFAGCNTFRGTYSIDGGRLALGPLASTKIGCERPASAVEADYLAALTRVTTWSIPGDGRLLLGGPVPLTFSRS